MSVGGDECVAKLQKALPRCIASEMRCRSQAVERGSRFTTPIRRPSSATSAQPSFPQAPDVSTATGTKSTPLQMSEYLAVFRASADAAADPDATLHACT